MQLQPVPEKSNKPKNGPPKKPIYKQLVLEPWEEDQQKRKKKAKHQSLHNQTGFDSAGGADGEDAVGEEDEDMDEIAELQEIDKQKQLQEKMLQQ